MVDLHDVPARDPGPADPLVEQRVVEDQHVVADHGSVGVYTARTVNVQSRERWCLKRHVLAQVPAELGEQPLADERRRLVVQNASRCSGA